VKPYPTFNPASHLRCTPKPKSYSGIGGRERALDPAGVGAGEIRARDQRLDLPGLPAVARQDSALPLAGATVLGVQPGAWHGELDRAERAEQLAPTMPMTVARRRCLSVCNLG
jgi:hypothetical protein